MYRITICDDREYCRRFIREELEAFFRSTEADYALSEFSSGDAFLFHMRPGIADIVFFDVEMNGTNGIETAKRFRAIDPNAIIIFMTVHGETVFSSFLAEPLTFLTKPIDREDLHETLTRAIEKVNTNRSEKFIFRSNKSVYAIPVRELIYLESQGRTILVHTRKAISNYYGRLNDEERNPIIKGFIRCHQSFFVNPDHIQEVSNNEILLSNGDRIPIRRGKSKEIREQIVVYLSNLKP